MARSNLRLRSRCLLAGRSGYGLTAILAKAARLRPRKNPDQSPDGYVNAQAGNCARLKAWQSNLSRLCYSQFVLCQMPKRRPLTTFSTTPGRDVKMVPLQVVEESAYSPVAQW